jgi:hypothetical protein
MLDILVLVVIIATKLNTDTNRDANRLTNLLRTANSLLKKRFHVLKVCEHFQFGGTK